MLNHTYSLLGVETYKQTATRKISTGDVTLKMLFEADEPKPGSGGTVTLYADDEQIGEGRIDKTVPIAFSSYAGMDIGRDNGLVVDRAYEAKAPYAFTGTVKRVVFDLKPVALRRPPGTPRGGAPGGRGSCGQCVSERRERDRTRQRHEKGVVRWLGLTLPGRGFDRAWFSPATRDGGMNQNRDAFEARRDNRERNHNGREAARTLVLRR